MISLDLTKSSEVRKAGDRSNSVLSKREKTKNVIYQKPHIWLDILHPLPIYLYIHIYSKVVWQNSNDTRTGHLSLP